MDYDIALSHLQEMVDEYQVSGVLLMIAGICEDKAELEADVILSHSWKDDGVKIYDLAMKLHN